MIKQDLPHNTFSFIVPESSNSCRVDRYVTELFPHYSRNYLQQVIVAGGIAINDVIKKKPSTPICTNDTIVVHFPSLSVKPANIIVDETINVSIIAETDHFMVIQKPAHLLVHAPSTTSTAITLVDWIHHYHSAISSIGSNDRPGIIHRLDKETSGIMIITRTHYAHNAIGELFRNRHIRKTYKAIVEGHPKKEGTITFAIGRDPANRIKMKTFDAEQGDEEGKIGNIKVRNAKTDYRVLEYFSDAALIEVQPTTGRTHQIRVHMKALGHPVLGDQLYASKSPLIDRQALHAESLAFTFDGISYSFNSNLPDDFQRVLNNLRTGTIAL